jgi:hypothetical protein
MAARIPYAPGQIIIFEIQPDVHITADDEQRTS